MSSASDPRSGSRRPDVAGMQVAWFATMLLTVVLGSVGFVDGWSRPDLLGGPLGELLVELGVSFHAATLVGLVAPLLAYLVLAGFVFWRRPGDRMAALFGIATVGFYVVASRSLGVAFVTQPALRPAIVALTFLAVGAVALLLALFPDGTPRPRWGLSAPLLLLLAVGVYPSFVEAQVGLPELPEAAGRFRLAAALASVGFALGLAAQVVRYRQSPALQRRQIKWVLTPLGLFLGVTVLVLGASAVGVLSPRSFAIGLLAVTPLGLLMPVAWARAILRYRLYEIDRLISRTVTYVCVVAVLGAAWVTAVVALGTALAPLAGERGGDLAVAAATLVAVVLFLPIRARVQAAVDRRFNRTGYQARQAVDSFAERIRDQVDLDAIRDELARTALTSVQPTHLSISLSAASPPSARPGSNP